MWKKISTKNFNLIRLLKQNDAPHDTPNPADHDNSEEKLKDATQKVDPKQSACSGVGVIGVGTAQSCETGTDCSLKHAR